jgi:hypothetical protein
MELALTVVVAEIILVFHPEASLNPSTEPNPVTGSYPDPAL